MLFRSAISCRIILYKNIIPTIIFLVDKHVTVANVFLRYYNMKVTVHIYTVKVFSFSSSIYWTEIETNHLLCYSKLLVINFSVDNTENTYYSIECITFERNSEEYYFYCCFTFLQQHTFAQWFLILLYNSQWSNKPVFYWRYYFDCLHYSVWNKDRRQSINLVEACKYMKKFLVSVFDNDDDDVSMDCVNYTVRSRDRNLFFSWQSKELHSNLLFAMVK